MKLNEREFMPVILGADITCYSLVRTFHEEYGIKSLVISQRRARIISESKLVENRVIPGLDDEAYLVEKLVEIGKEFKGKKKLILMGCGDFYVRNFVDNKDVLGEYYIIPYIDRELMDEIVLKFCSYHILPSSEKACHQRHVLFHLLSESFCPPEQDTGVPEKFS